MELLNAAKTGKKERPIKVLQFGEGNFYVRLLIT